MVRVRAIGLDNNSTQLTVMNDIISTVTWRKSAFSFKAYQSASTYR